jgi:tetratricopeptide (TPR) repeat protein
LAAILVALAASGAWFWNRPEPSKLLAQGLAVGRRDPAAGERLVRRALAAADRTYPDAQIALCSLLADQGAWEEALRQFDQVDKAACRADLLLSFGRAALESNRVKAALAALAEVRRRGTQESAAALELLIANYEEWGQKDNLLMAAHDLTRLQPDNPRPWALLVERLKADVGRELECLAAIREALDRDLPEDFHRELRHRYVEQLIICGDADEARREVDGLKQLEGESFRMRACEVDLYRLEGRPDKALEAMNSLFAEARDPAAASLNRGIIYLDLGRYEEAVHDLEQTVAAQPMNAAAHFKLSEAYRGLKRDEPARRHRETALGINEKRGRIGKLQNRLRRESDDRQIYEELAMLCRETGDLEAANKWQQLAARVAVPAPESNR